MSNHELSAQDLGKETDQTFSIFASKMPIIEVGHESRIFRVHKDLICDRVPLFKSSVMGEFKERVTKYLDCQQDEPDTFERLITWMYDGGVIKPEESQGGDSTALVGFYILAGKYCLEGLKNGIMDALRRWYRRRILDSNALRQIAADGPAQSMMKKFIFKQGAFDILFEG